MQQHQDSRRRILYLFSKMGFVWWMWKEILRMIHVFNNLLLGSCSGQLRLRPARTRPFVNYIIHKNNGMYKCREKC